MKGDPTAAMPLPPEEVAPTAPVGPRRAGGDIQGSLATPPPEVGVTRSSPSLDPLPGEEARSSPGHIGRYTLLGELGRGGMGVVFRAFDPQLDRTVALKMLLWGGLAGEQAQRRFATEAKAVARLSHPGIVSVYDTGRVDGCPYYTMEYVPGPTLRTWMEHKGALSPEEAAGLIAQIGRAVHHAHQHGVIHRDLKPANVLMGEGDLPRVSDFGVARMDLDDSLTATGQVLGTPAYMAPEQALADPARVGPWSDVYALGAMLFHLVAGKAPFPGADLALVPGRVKRPPPSVRAVRSDVPLDLDTVCQKAMAPSPTDRYGSAQALAEDLERFLRGEPVAASRPTLQRRLVWQLTRHRNLLAGAGMTAVLALVVLGVGLWWLGRATLQERQAREDAAADRLERLNQELSTLEGEGKTALGERSLTAFLELPDVQGTLAQVQALTMASDRALERSDFGEALSHLARAYVLAQSEDARVTALLGLSRAFLSQGDLPQLEALDQLIGEIEPRAELAAAYAAHRQTLNGARRKLPAVIDDFKRGGGGDAMVATLTAFSTYMDTGERADYEVVSQRTRGLSRRRSGDYFTRATVVVPAEAAPSAPRRIQQTRSPEGFSFFQAPQALGMWEGSPLFAVSFTSRDRQNKDVHSGLFVLRGGEYTPIWRQERRMIHASCRGDMNGDGEDEFYIEPAGRRLHVVSRVRGGEFTVAPVTGPGALAGSDVRSCFVADLDKDGRNELVVASEVWRAYDVRVYHGTSTAGRLEMVARRKLGVVIDVAPFAQPDGKLGILVQRAQDNPNLRVFPTSRPNGFPVGAYLLTLKSGRLDMEGWLPAPVPNGISDRLVVGDFNGDGLDDVAIQTPISPAGQPSPMHRQYMQLAISTRQNRVESLLLRGLIPWWSLQADADPADELLVEDEQSHALWILGAGNTPLPPFQGPGASMQGAPGQDAWGRLEDLLELGITETGLEQLRQLAATTSDPKAAARTLVSAGEIALSRKLPVEARELFALAMAQDPQMLEAALKLRESLELLWEHEEELTVVDALVARADLLPTERGRLQQRQRWLKGVTSRPRVSVDFSRDLDPGWQISSPHLVWHDQGRGRLVVRGQTGLHQLVGLPVRWDGGRLTLRVKLDVDRLEWGSSIAVGLVPVGGALNRDMIGIYLDGHGGGGQLRRLITAGLPSEFRHVFQDDPVADVGQTPAFEARLEIDPEARRLSMRSGRRYREEDFSASHTPVPGDYLLVVATPSPALGGTAVIQIALESLEVEGVQAQERPLTPGQQIAQLITRGEFGPAREALSSWSGSEAERSFLSGALALRGSDLASSREGFSRLKREDVMASPPLRSILVEQLRQAPAAIMPALFTLWGWGALEAFDDAWSNPAYAHPRDPDVLVATTAGLSIFDAPTLPDVVGEKTIVLTLSAMMLRGQSWRQMGQHSLARLALEQAESFAGHKEHLVKDPALLSQWADTRWRVHYELAISYAQTGQLNQSRDQFQLAIQTATDPWLMADMAACLPELTRLLPRLPLPPGVELPDWTQPPRLDRDTP